VNGKPGSGCRRGSHVEASVGEAVDSVTRVAPKTPGSPNKRKMAPTETAQPVAKKPRVSKNPTAIQVVKIVPAGVNVVVASATPQLSSARKPSDIP